MTGLEEDDQVLAFYFLVDPFNFRAKVCRDSISISEMANFEW
jgi:hypothetical protein